MHTPLLGILLLALQSPVRLDSAELARVLAQLRASDSTVCELAGQSLADYGGFWGRGRDFSNASLPMPGGGGGRAGVMRDVMHGHEGHKSGIDNATLGAFRAVLRDDNRCIRNIAARVLAAWALGEIEAESGVEPRLAALKDPDIDVRVAAAWALGEIESPLALDGLKAAQQDVSGAVRRAATWALRQIDDETQPRVRVRVRPRVKVRS
jgi:hypothetical protein